MLVFYDRNDARALSNERRKPINSLTRSTPAGRSSALLRGNHPPKINMEWNEEDGFYGEDGDGYEADADSREVH